SLFFARRLARRESSPSNISPPRKAAGARPPGPLVRAAGDPPLPRLHGDVLHPHPVGMLDLLEAHMPIHDLARQIFGGSASGTLSVILRALFEIGVLRRAADADEVRDEPAVRLVVDRREGEIELA